MAETIRAFLAVELTDRMKEEAFQFVRPIQAALKSFRLIDPKNWHLTLHFFGAISQADVNRVKAGLETSLEDAASFSISLEGLGAFPNLKRPNLIWIGMAGDLGRLEILKSKVDGALSLLGFPIEKRAFHPHITIARAKNRAPSKPFSVSSSFKGSVVDKIEKVTLFQSHLSPAGAQYTPLSHTSLGRSK
jgi:2'-5' RNA ligase